MNYNIVRCIKYTKCTCIIYKMYIFLQCMHSASPLCDVFPASELKYNLAENRAGALVLAANALNTNLSICAID